MEHGGPTPPIDGSDGRLWARPGRPTVQPESGPGVQILSSGQGHDAQLLVPRSIDPQRPAPLLVMLHGATYDASDSTRMVAACEERGVLVLAPKSQGETWDVVHGAYGPDVVLLDVLLAWTMERYLVDPAHVAIGGFADGAAYALSIGLMNGDLFTDVLAFSPGFVAPLSRTGRPRIFIAHGASDDVWPPERGGRPLAGHFAEEGYDVAYREFDGGHELPPDTFQVGIGHFLAERPESR